MEYQEQPKSGKIKPLQPGKEERKLHLRFSEEGQGMLLKLEKPGLA